MVGRSCMEHVRASAAASGDAVTPAGVLVTAPITSGMRWSINVTIIKKALLILISEPISEFGAPVHAHR